MLPTTFYGNQKQPSFATVTGYPRSLIPNLRLSRGQDLPNFIEEAEAPQVVENGMHEGMSLLGGSSHDL